MKPFDIENKLNIKSGEIQSIRMKIVGNPYSYSYGISSWFWISIGLYFFYLFFWKEMGGCGRMAVWLIINFMQQNDIYIGSRLLFVRLCWDFILVVSWTRVPLASVWVNLVYWDHKQNQQTDYILFLWHSSCLPIIYFHK